MKVLESLKREILDLLACLNDRQIGMAVGVLVFLNLLCTLGLTLFLLLSCFFFLCFELIRRKIDVIHKKGLVNYLPEPLKVALLDRSIFDYLCDIWYVPKLSILLKAIFKPMVIKTDAEEAENNLAELEPAVQQAIKTKGIVNIFSPSLQKILLPKGHYITNYPMLLAGLEPQSTEHLDTPLGTPMNQETAESLNRATFPVVKFKKAKENLAMNLVDLNQSQEGRLVGIAAKNQKTSKKAAGGASGWPRMKIISTNKSTKVARDIMKSKVVSKWDKLEHFISLEKNKIRQHTQGVSLIIPSLIFCILPLSF